MLLKTLRSHPMPHIYLSPPHLSGRERQFVNEAFATNWLAPLGPNVDAFEAEFCAATGARYALATSSGTAALHLALILAGVETGDEVLVSTLTFAASANPVVYLGGRPTFLDSERVSWNMDPSLLEKTLAQRARRRHLPKAVVLVHLFGQSADVNPILAACRHYGVPLIEDAAEALGAEYKGHVPGTLGDYGIYSFNGNKIITTSGGGMLVAGNAERIARARKLATQARDPAPYYQHSSIGFNYRMSNVLAGIGRGQLAVLAERVAARRRIFARYQALLGHLRGLHFMPEPLWGTATHWLTAITLDPTTFGAGVEELRLALEAADIESRRVWKPLHLQPVFAGCEHIGGAVAEDLFAFGLCLPSGSNLTDAEIQHVAEVICAAAGRAHQPQAWFVPLQLPYVRSSLT
jgi:pyridoxal phosphate-dependent aminotransferase EpsN